MNLSHFLCPSTRTRLAQLAGHASINTKHWANLVGFGPVHGIWQNRRYSLRFRSALWATMIALAVLVAGQADSWAPRLDPVTECYAEAAEGRPFQVEVDDVSSPPHGVVCEESRPWNAAAYFAFFLLSVASWIMVGFLIADPSKSGVLIYRPRDEAGRIAVRYALTIELPEIIEVAQKDLASLPPEDVKRWLVDHMAYRIKTTIQPFADDIAFLKGEGASKPKGWAAKWQAMRANWWTWCHAETASYCYVNPESDEEDKTGV